METIKLLVKGRNACFTRPEMKVERVSYDVITPSAARGIFEALHWKPAIRWRIERIHVFSPVRFESFRRNEIASKIPVGSARKAMRRNDLKGLNLNVDENRHQRAMLCLSHVSYGLEARFELTDAAGPDDNPGKHAEMFRRRAMKGQCFHQPYLGVREFPADFSLVDGFPPSDLGDRDFGWMLYDIDFIDDPSPVFFHARMWNGVIDVGECLKAGTAG